MRKSRSIDIKDKAFNLDNLSYLILPGKFVSKQHGVVHEKIYRFWKSQWEPIFKMISGESFVGIPSDDFLRQAEVTAIFYMDEVVGVLCLDQFELSSEIHLNHSYFKQIPKEVLFELDFLESKEVLIINQLAVSKLWRGELGIADLLVGLAVKRMKNSHIQNTLCYTRNLRKTNELAFRWGGQVLAQNIQIHGEPSDFIVFPKNCFDLSVSHPLYGVVDQLWRRRLHIDGLFQFNKIENEVSKYLSKKSEEIKDETIELENHI